MLGKVKVLYTRDMQPGKCKEAGIPTCICCEFSGAAALTWYSSLKEVHGLLPYEDYRGEELVKYFIEEALRYEQEVIECKDIDEFIQRIQEYPQD